MASAPRMLPEPDLYYPETDGRPMAENTIQYRWIVTIKEGLDDWLSGDREAFVAADLFWYPIHGDRDTRVAPDVLVALGRLKGERRSYLQWKEDGIAPQVVFEILSPGNTKREMAEKLAFYEQHGVDEYYVYDPDENQLTGWLRRRDALQAIEDISGWQSPLLQVRFIPGPKELSIVRADGEVFETAQATIQQKRAARREAEAERQRAEAERQRAQDASDQARTERLRADLERQRADDANDRAESERQRAERLAERMRALGLDPDEI